MLSKKKAFDDDKQSKFVKAVSDMLAIQMVAAPRNSLEDAESRINRKAIGYIYGFVDCALRSIGQDMGDASVGVPITYQILRALFPGREQVYMTFLNDHLKDATLIIGMMAGGQQYADFIIKPGVKGMPMGLARFILEGERNPE